MVIQNDITSHKTLNFPKQYDAMSVANIVIEITLESLWEKG